MTGAADEYRVLFVLWAGDYREAWQRLSTGGAEQYYAQRYSVESVAAIGRRFGIAGQLSILSDHAYDETLANGVRAMGVGADRSSDLSEVLPCMEAFKPTHVVLGTPKTRIMQWCFDHDVAVLPIFADSFNESEGTTGGMFQPRQWLRGLRRRRDLSTLVAQLNDARVQWVGNHNVGASAQLVALGVAGSKVVPWDWPAAITPENYKPKTLRRDAGEPWRIVFVGHVSELKGVGDLLRAAALLSEQGREFELKAIGGGDIERFGSEAERFGIASCCTFVGRLPHDEVVKAVREADVAVVPSRAEAAEGLPMTIYEALAVRTPLVLSRHAMFERVTRHSEAVASFSCGDVTALAEAIEDVLSDAARYEQMSQQSAAVWRSICCEVRFYDLVERWLRDLPEDRQWLTEHAMSRVERGREVNAA